MFLSLRYIVACAAGEMARYRRHVDTVDAQVYLTPLCSLGLVLLLLLPHPFVLVRRIIPICFFPWLFLRWLAECRVRTFLTFG